MASPLSTLQVQAINERFAGMGRTCPACLEPCSLTINGTCPTCYKVTHRIAETSTRRGSR